MIDFKQFLLEDAFFERYPQLYQDLKTYKNKYIHFSQGIPKSNSKNESDFEPMMQINVKKTHHDPYGIYGYPTSWLFKKIDDSSSFQYAVSYPYYYIFSVTKSAKGINIARLSDRECTKIATAANIYDYFLEVLEHPDFYLKNYPGDVVKKLIKKQRHLGAALYATMDTLANYKHINTLFKDVKFGDFHWTDFFKGYDYVVDTGKGIINEGEPSQIIVLNPKVIKVVKFGMNKRSDMKNDIPKGKELFSRFGAKNFKMKNDKLITTIRYDNKYPVRMTYDFNNLSVWLEYYANGQYEKQKIRLEPYLWDREQKDQNDDLAWHIKDSLGKANLSTKKSGQYFDVKKQTNIFENNLYYYSWRFNRNEEINGKLVREGYYYETDVYTTYIKTFADKTTLQIEFEVVARDESPFKYKKRFTLERDDDYEEIDGKFIEFNADFLREYFNMMREERYQQLIDNDNLAGILNNWFGFKITKDQIDMGKIMHEHDKK